MNELYLLPNLELSNSFYPKNDIIQLYSDFKENKVNCKLVIIDEKALTNFAFLQVIDSAKTLVIFDQILGINCKNTCPLFLSDLNIPPEYVPNYENICDNKIQYWHKGKMVMSVNIDKRGFVKTVKRFIEKVMITDTYDVRGFKITSEYFFMGDKKFFMKKWFSNDGSLVMCEKNGRIAISKNSQSRFDFKYYVEKIDIIKEFILKKSHCPNPNFIADTWECTIKLKKVMPRSDFIFVISRLAEFANVDFNKTIYSNFVFLNKSLKEQFINAGQNKNLSHFCHVLMPYFSEPRLGISNEIMSQIIYWNVGSITYREVEEYLNILLKVIDAREDIKVIAEVDEQRAGFLFQQIQSMVNEIKQLISKKDTTNKMELLNKLDVLDRFSYQTSSLEKQIELLNLARLYIDTNKISDFTLQWHAVQVGIPLFAKQDNDLIKAGKNGEVIDETNRLFSQVTSYLLSLQKWNQAVVEDIKIIEQKTLQKSILSWKEMI